MKTDGWLLDRISGILVLVYVVVYRSYEALTLSSIQLSTPLESQVAFLAQLTA